MYDLSLWPLSKWRGAKGGRMIIRRGGRMIIRPYTRALAGRGSRASFGGCGI